MSFKSLQKYFFLEEKRREVFKSIFEFFHKKILQDCVLAVKAIYDGVVFLARSCGGATRSSAPFRQPVLGIEPVAPTTTVALRSL